MTERKEEKERERVRKTKAERERNEEKGGERTHKQAIFKYFLYFILFFL
jgi:hypothetical protein